MFAGFSLRRFVFTAQVAALSLALAACTPPAPPDDEGAGSSASSLPSQMPVSSRAASAGSSAAAVLESRYTDGTYSAVGTYRSPNGDESINVTLTLADNVVTAASVQSNATFEKSITMQGQFIAGFEAEVVGKSIDELNLTVVNGSSLTPIGFMEAGKQIKVQAQAS